MVPSLMRFQFLLFLSNDSDAAIQIIFPSLAKTSDIQVSPYWTLFTGH
jgi:hypothetical protein